jgi:hypothetical protein
LTRSAKILDQVTEHELRRGAAARRRAARKGKDEPGEGVSSDTDDERLSESDTGGLVNGLVVEGSRSRDDSYEFESSMNTKERGKETERNGG